MMFDQDDNPTAVDDLIPTLGIEDFLCGRDLGRDRGRHPEPSESQRRTLEKLASKLYVRPPKNARPTEEETDEIVEDLDLLDAPRIILFDGKILKKSLNAIVNHTSSRHMFLFNDLIIITSYQKESSKMSLLKMSDKYAIHQALTFDKLALHSKSTEEPENPCAFELHTPDRIYTIIVPSESDKRIWLEEIELAIYAWHYGTTRSGQLGWQHETILGTIFSDAFLGNEEGVLQHIQNGVNLSTTDASGMNPLHWAALRGHAPIVKLLLNNGCDIDSLNNGLNSALLLAAAYGHDHIIRLLIERGADISLRNLKDRDVLFMTTLYGHSSKGLANILQILHFHHIDFDQFDSSGSTSLHECATRNLSRPIRLLVHAGANVNTKHGRTGVTPLQLACSLENPDIETVRSFLDNGAHPNWKDSSGKSAFNMMLSAHKAGSSTVAPDGESVEDMASKMEKYSSWVQNALPVLMELVRKGGRYTEDSISDLRDSFKAAIDSARVSWLACPLPDNFEDFVEAKGQMIGNPEWVHNNAAAYCLLCVEKFTYSNRRHHCRACGTLCCAPCSTKRLPLQLNNTRTSRGGNQSGGDRVCDGCFNRLISEATTRNIALAKAKKEMLLQLEKEKLEDQKQELLKTTSVSSSPVNSPKQSGNLSSEQDSISELKDTLGATGEALKERGEKLTNLAEKSENLEQAASDYNKMAKQLLVQQQERSGGTWRRKR